MAYQENKSAYKVQALAHSAQLLYNFNKVHYDYFKILVNMNKRVWKFAVKLI